ncbi:MAG: Calx-beta domain-containing protein [Winogradskyella arenosi]
MSLLHLYSETNKPIAMKKITLLILIVLQSFLSFSQNPHVFINTLGNPVEGDAVSFKLMMYSPAITDIVVHVETASNTADITDYTPLNTTVTIPAGQSSSDQIVIQTTHDFNVEQDELFRIDATVVSNNAGNKKTSKSIYIMDNDAVPTLSQSNGTTIIEGNSINKYFELSNYYHSDIVIDFSTLPGYADNLDYITTTSSVTIPAGERFASFTMYTLQDDIPESDEDYTVIANLTSGNTINVIEEFVVTIIDDDVAPTLSMEVPYSSQENYSAHVIVYLDRVFNSDVVIEFETSDGTANHLDYSSFTETKIIEAGDYVLEFQIPITDDELDEPNETINLTATVVSGNTSNINESTVVTIIDNDGLPDLYLEPINNPNLQEHHGSLVAEEGYDLEFVVKLTHDSPVATEVEITTISGSADASDYTTSTTTATILAGEGSVSEPFSIATTLDQLDEGSENIFVTATVNSGNTYNLEHTLEGTILDNFDLNAQSDTVNVVFGLGATFQVLDNDTFEGLPVNPTNLNVALLDGNTEGITLSSTGVLSIPSNIPKGYYDIEYQICEGENSSNCDTANIGIRILSPLDVDYIATYIDYNNDGYTSAGDIIEYEFNVTNNGNAPITGLDASVLFQNMDVVGGPLSSLGAGQSDSTTFTSFNIVEQYEINLGYGFYLDQNVAFYGIYDNYELEEFVDDLNPVELQQSDGIKLNAFVDSNGNGTQEFNEINFPLGAFNYITNNDGIINNLYVSPHYLYESNSSTTYDLTFVIDADYAANNSTISYSNITVPVGSGITTYDFPIAVASYDDLTVDIATGNGPPVPGYTYSNRIGYTNNSNETVSSGTINFTMDNTLNLMNVYDATSTYFSEEGDQLASISITDTGFAYTFNNLEPYETKNLWVKMQVPTIPIVSLGQLVTNTVDIELLTGDILPLNNTSSLMETIVGSYDPNDITERHGEEIEFSSFTGDDYLTYTIRFENIGTANAINVRIEDLLDEKLDVSTLKMVDASHNYALERVGSHLEWNFAAIDLPPSIGEEGSLIGHGFITFKIKPLPDYEIGAVIANTAEIYFDFNPAIITNTWTTTFVESLSLNESIFNELNMYPTPAKDKLHISNNSIISSLEMTTMQGKQVFNRAINEYSIELDVSDYAPGVYVLKVKSTNQIRVLKFLKE